MATNGFTLGTAWVQISPSMRGLVPAIQRELGTINGSAAGNAVGTSMGGGIMTGLRNSVLGGAVAGIMASVTSSVTASFQELASEAITASDATDKFKSTLGFAGVDTSGIEALTASTQEYADKTIYGLGDIQNVTAQLAANSVKDYDKLAEAAGNLNAVAGGNAETFKSVGMVLTQTAGQGKLTTENWNQLSDAIPGASGRMQEAMLAAGAYTGNFRDAMAKGEITADEFNAALLQLGSEPVAVEAATSVTTFEGMLGNLEATIVGSLAGGLNELKPLIGEAFGVLGDVVGPALALAVDGLVGFGEGLRGIWSIIAEGDFTSLFGLYEDNPIVRFLFAVHDAGPGVAAAIGSIWDSLQSLGPVLGAVLENLAPMGELLVGAVRIGFDLIAGAVNIAAGALGGLEPWLPLITTGLIGVTAGIVAWKVVMLASAAATVIATIASNAWAAAQWVMVGAANAGAVAQRILNAAMAANPIGIIITAVVALVAALVWFFTQTELGQSIWQGFVDVLATAWNWLWTTVLQPVFTAIGAIFTWIYETIISPIVAGIVLYVQAWAAVFTWLWTNILSPTFQVIGAIFQWLWDVVISVVIISITAAIQGLGLIFTWLYANVISPVFTAVGAIFTWIYNTIIVPIITGVVLYIQMWAAIFTWLWTSIISPTFTAIGALFTWLYVNVVQPVWSGIQAAIQVVADWIAVTLWPGIEKTLGYMGAGFQLLKDTVTTVWEAIKTAAMAPVRFVVESVYRDGIKATFDSIAEAVGLDTRLPDPPSLSFASGGVLPGYTPGRDVFDFISPNGGGHLRLSGGEAFMRPEFTRAVGGIRGVNALNALARRGRLGEVFGGSQAFADGGIWSAVGATFDGVGDWLANVASNVAQIISDPAGAISNLIAKPVENLLSSIGGGTFGSMLSAMPGKWIDRLSEWFADLVRPTTSGAVGNWQGGQTLARLLPYIAQTGTIITDTYRDPAYNAAVGGTRTSYHMDAANPAVDVAGSNEAMWAFYRLVMADPGGWRQVLWQVAGHYDHVHVANRGGVFGDLPTYDNGGWLQPGLTLAYNASGRPEPVFSDSQWSAIERGGLNGSPRELVVVDQDGDLIGRMRVEAADVAVRALEGVSR